MSKTISVVSPEVSYDSLTGMYTLMVPDVEDSHGEQIFRGPTVEALASKLGASAMHATAKIRDLSRELADLRDDYSITRDVTNLLAALLLIKHASTDAPVRAVDAMLRSLTKDLQARLPEAPEKESEKATPKK